MKKCRLTMIMVMTMLVTALAWGFGPGQAQAADGNGQGNSKVAEKLKWVAARTAAAARAKAEGLQVGVAATPSTAVPLAAAGLPTDSQGHLIPDYFGVANWAFSPIMQKFVDPLPVLPVANPDVVTYPGADYYEIALQQYSQQMMSSTTPGATLLRGYVQLNNGTDVLGSGCSVPVPGAPTATDCTAVNNTLAPAAIQYMGPIIIAQRDRPVRIKFIDNLPTGAGGDLFIPVDPSVMGSGMGPLAPAGATDQDCNPDATKSARPRWCYTQNRAVMHLHGNNTIWISDGWPHQQITPAGENTPYRKGVSNHNVPDMWFDATTHATITSCAGQLTCKVAGATHDPGPGAWTIYYTNAQSARLLFYHDHAWGLTRLNVYAGEAAPYYIDDPVEEDLEDGTNNTGVNPGLTQVLPQELQEIPLVIQDRTFVDPATIGATDPTWLDPTEATFGTTPGTAHAGDLWYPHVYLPNQNPSQIDGANPFGKWDYGPWWFPYVNPAGSSSIPGSALMSGPLPNPYCLPTPGSDCSQTPWENPTIPGTPSNSWTGEAFVDTPIVNGKAYPVLNVEPKAYRFHILSISNDRMFDLQMYMANPGIVGSLTTTAGAGYTADPVVTVTNAAGDTTGHGFTLTATADVTPGSPTLGQVTFAIQTVGSNYTKPPIITVTNAAGDTTGTGASATALLYGAAAGQDTEVGMIPLPATEPSIAPYFNSGMPDPAFSGPHFWQIGTEGGFLSAPVDIPNQHIVFNMNPKTFNFGNVLNHSLLLGPAERADAVVDFSAFAGKTIILYNDAPAPLPAADPRNDFYTADQDNTATGGAPTTLPGYGPNTRTIMKIVVAPTVTNPGPTVTFAGLQAAWAKTATKRGVFEASHPENPIVVPQAAYDSAYNNTFDSTVSGQYIQFGQYSKSFQPIDSTGALHPAVTLPIQQKAMHDEMGGVWDHYGRMSGMLGLDVPGTNAQTEQFIPYGFSSPPVDLMTGTVSGTLVGSLGDGTQIWALIQNGVDTHAIHFHLFNLQIINRVGWDGMLIPPDPNELGWKETIRVNPLEVTFVAMRPVIPMAPQALLDRIPNDVRLIDPSKPAGAMLMPPPNGWFDPNGNNVTSILNHKVNYGWDYMWHCHILAHEENDMMHAIAVAVAPAAPAGLAATVTNGAVVLTWKDRSANETGWVIQRAATSAGPWTMVKWLKSTTAPGKNATVAFSDLTVAPATTYYYRVRAANVVGDVATPGWPTLRKVSAFSKTLKVTTQ